MQKSRWITANPTIQVLLSSGTQIQLIGSPKVMVFFEIKNIHGFRDFA